MIDKGKRSVLGVGVNVVDYDAAVSRIIDAAVAKQPLGVSALAVHGVMTGALDRTHKYRLNRLELVTPDGQPVRWALRLLHGENLPDRVYGPKLTLLICAAAAERGLSVYLYGSRQEVLDTWVSNLSAKYPNLKIAGSEPSKFRHLTSGEQTDLDQRILESGASIVFVGLGCPRQEVFVYEHTAALRLPVLAVGAAFDFHAGLLKQAPKWMQDRGLEWAFRLWTEPRRLWRRYLYLNPLYLLMVAGQKTGLLDTQLARETPPVETIRYG
jgi:N-acetylglucosaminyldiphosphoundecaprenol N-acetyl-beta-D-mannosaminyltransferase